MTDVPNIKAGPENSTLSVMDLFCGAGGFSEGFRAAGYQIVHGEDMWQPAIDTFNISFGLDMKPRDLLYFEGPFERIDELPNTHVIIGSPPCVSFSYSNRLGNGDKTLGIRLTKVFLRIVAVKKFQAQSVLTAWFMENVPNAGKWLKKKYTFRDLKLAKWAERQGKHPYEIAIDLGEKVRVHNSASLGVPQVRKRLFVIEYLRGSRRTDAENCRPKAISLGKVLSSLPPPNSKRDFERRVVDPLYPEIAIRLHDLRDHFYDSGAYEAHWRESQYLKVNHPYMGRMSFPEKLNRPARTVVATNLARCREAMLLKSEWGHKGDGEYRTLTAREAACLMSFPITYQFAGNESAKWKLVGNAVCPMVAYQLASELNAALGRPRVALPRFNSPSRTDELENLNTFSPKQYTNPPKKMKQARFRRHPLKEAAMTVALTNFSLTTRGPVDGVWRCFVTDGIGSGYKVRLLNAKHLRGLKDLVVAQGKNGKAFARAVGNGFASDVRGAKELQSRFERDVSLQDPLNPVVLVERAAILISRYSTPGNHVEVSRSLFLRERIPESQLLAAYALCHVVALAQKGKGLSK